MRLFISSKEIRGILPKGRLTWFRRERDVIWIEKDKFAYDNNQILKYMINKCNAGEEG